MGCNPAVLRCIFGENRATIRTTKTKGARPIEKQPIVIHMNQLLLELDEGPLRAAYMVIKELHDLQQASRKE
jgi:hypothetical protein